MFKEFLRILPSNSRAIYFLETHDFGSPFSLDSLSELEKFVNEWSCSEKEFLDPELEEKRKELWKLCHKFDWLIAEKSGPTRVGRQSVVPERHWDDWDWPEHVDKAVNEVNNLASEVFKMHKQFIRFAREKLTC